jgi:replicative DNA helicase
MQHLDHETFSRFGKKFQENMCQLMLEDRPFYDQIIEVLNINFFEKKYLQIFTEMLINYREEYQTHPNLQVMEIKLRTELNHHDKLTAKSVTDFFTRIKSSGKIEESEYVKDKAIDFCRKQVLKEAMMKSVKLLKSSSFDQIEKVIQDALKLGTDNNFGHHFIKDAHSRFEHISRDPITTGWDRMDEICKGGLGKNELGVVIAPTGAGKSMVLVHLACQGIKQGKTVVYYTLELKDTVVGARFDCCLTNTPLNEHKQRKNEILDNIHDLEGSLIIKEYPTKSASVQTIKNHIEKLRRRGIYPDMIMVDYADLLRPTRSSGEKRHELEETYEGLRGLAQTFELPIWTASQTNRSGLNAEVITMESISEAFNKCFVADFIFSLSRTVQDKSANKGRLFIAKNRNGPDGMVFQSHVDWSDVTIKILDRDDTVNVMESVEDTHQKLKSVYSSRFQQNRS